MGKCGNCLNRKYAKFLDFVDRITNFFDLKIPKDTLKGYLDKLETNFDRRKKKIDEMREEKAGKDKITKALESMVLNLKRTLMKIFHSNSQWVKNVGNAEMVAVETQKLDAILALTEKQF